MRLPFVAFLFITLSLRADSQATTADVNPTAAQLWSIQYYYNWNVGVHAFCADATCLQSIRNNGIGYDMAHGKSLLGKAVSESAIAAVRTACPTRSKNLRNLGFVKSGRHYNYNLTGAGLKQGWVSTVKGSCGATVPIKAWRSRVSDDRMYGVNLEWDSWYKGMVQEGGNVLFYLWK